MVCPKAPGADKHDENEQVAPQFAETPGLTPIAPFGPHSDYYDISRDVRRDLQALYRKYELKQCRNYGLYWAGSRYWVKCPDRRRTMLLVLELKQTDLGRWWKIDGDVKKILNKPEYALCGEQDVCLRYYLHWEQPRNEGLAEQAHDEHRQQMIAFRNQELFTPQTPRMTIGRLSAYVGGLPQQTTIDSVTGFVELSIAELLNDTHWKQTLCERNGQKLSPSLVPRLRNLRNFVQDSPPGMPVRPLQNYLQRLHILTNKNLLSKCTPAQSSRPLLRDTAIATRAGSVQGGEIYFGIGPSGEFEEVLTRPDDTMSSSEASEPDPVPDPLNHLTQALLMLELRQLQTAAQQRTRVREALRDMFGVRLD
ncbi:hypothetical protein LTR37_019871 [Vermiconidia calcicola]|uniref:Uncharacterized protein n=1 Tax=Vermiconidia calcicola TaxID=1690605 RepID=A0ACC3MCX9_9PEZI|nr:hypothetical protein LTR37_019871 [Vermiconidia calcicola]